MKKMTKKEWSDHVDKIFTKKVAEFRDGSHPSKVDGKRHNGTLDKCTICFEYMFDGKAPSVIGYKTGGKW